MGRIDISFETVSQKTEQLRRQMNEILTNDVLPGYDGIQTNIEQSCGAGIDALKEALDKEKRTVAEVCRFMEDLLEFIKDSADAFKHVDDNHEEVLKKFV